MVGLELVVIIDDSGADERQCRSFQKLVPRMLRPDKAARADEQTVGEAIEALVGAMGYLRWQPTDRKQSTTLAHAGSSSTQLPFTALSKQLFQWTSRLTSTDSPSHAICAALAPSSSGSEMANGHHPVEDTPKPAEPFTVGFIGLGAMGSGMVNGQSGRGDVMLCYAFLCRTMLILSSVVPGKHRCRRP